MIMCSYCASMFYYETVRSAAPVQTLQKSSEHLTVFSNPEVMDTGSSPEQGSTDSSGSESMGAEVSDLKVKEDEDEQGRLYVQVTYGDGKKVKVTSLAQLKSYRDWQLNYGIDEDYVQNMLDDFENVLRLLRANRVSIRGGRDCYGLIHNREGDLVSVKSPFGVLYYNSEQSLTTYGTLGQNTGATIRAIMAHISSRRNDAQGRPTNKIVLQKDTLYIIAGTEDPTSNRPVWFIEDDQEVYLVEKARLDATFGCDMYRKAHVGHLTVVRESRRGAELLFQTKKSEDRFDYCARCISRFHLPLLGDCGDVDCSVGCVFNCHSAPVRVINNDVVLAGSNTKRMGDLEFSHRFYVKVKKATQLALKLQKDPADYIKRIAEIARTRVEKVVLISSHSHFISQAFARVNTSFMLQRIHDGPLVQSVPSKLLFVLEALLVREGDEIYMRSDVRRVYVSCKTSGVLYISEDAVDKIEDWPEEVLLS